VTTPSAATDTTRPTRPQTTAALHSLLQRIESEYREMPGLCVTTQQAERLWGLDTATCRFVLMTLIARGTLRRTPRGTFVRAST